MSANAYGFIILLATSIGITLAVYALVWNSLRDLLDEALELPAGTTFYIRSFLIGVAFVTLSGAIGTTFDLKPEAHFMEYVWRFANGLSTVLGRFSLLWVAYLLLVTMLARSNRDK